MFETETLKLSFSGPEFRMRHTPKHHQSHFDDPGRKMMISRLVPDLDPGLRPKFHYSSLLPGPEIEFAQSLCQGHDGTMVSPGIETGTGVPLSPVLKSSKKSYIFKTFVSQKSTHVLQTVWQVFCNSCLSLVCWTSQRSDTAKKCNLHGQLFAILEKCEESTV